MAIDLLATLRLQDEFSAPLDRAESKVNSFNGTMGKLGVAAAAAAVGAGVAMVGLEKSVITTGMAYTESLSKVQAVTGATSAEMAAMKDVTMDLGASTVFSASEVADAAGYLGMAGFKTNEIMGALPDTLALAAAGGLDLARAADIASNVMSGFNLMGGDVEKQMKRVADVLASAATSSNTDINQLGDAMSYAAPIAEAYGISLEESAAGIAVFSNAGIQGSRAGMTLKNTISQLADPVGSTAKKLEELGLSAADVNPEVNSLSDILRTLEGAGAKATDAIALVGAEAGPGFASLMTVGADALDEFTTGFENAEGAAQKMSEVMVDNLGGDIKELESVWESFKLQLFFQQEGFLRDVVQGVTDLLTMVVEAIPKIEEFMSMFNAEYIQPFIEALFGGGEELGLFGQAVEALSPLLEALGGYFEAVAEQYSLLVDGMAEKFSNSTELIGQAWEILKEFFVSGVETVTDIVNTFVAFVEPAFTILGLAIDIVSYAAQWLFFNIIAPGAELAMSVFDAMWAVLGPILDLMAEVLGIAADAAVWLWENALVPLADFAGGVFKGAIETATSVVDGMATAFEWVGSKIEWATEKIKTFKDWVSNLEMPSFDFSLPSWAGGGGGGKKGGSHYHGIDNVPYNG